MARLLVNHRLLSFGSLAALAVCLFACDPPPEADPFATATAAPAPGAPTHAIDAFGAEADAVAALKPGGVLQHPDGVRSIISNDGAFRVAYVCAAESGAKTPSGPPPMNEPFVLQVSIFPRGGQQATAMIVDAAMPEHGHGMNVQPRVTQLRPGRFVVEDMLFHMSGRWEIYFDITRDGVTSRAQDELTLE